MSTTTSRRQEPDGTDFGSPTNYGRTGPRPTYFLLGTDEHGRDYVMDTLTDSVHVITRDEGRAHRYLLGEKTLDEFMAAVESAHGWAERHYGLGIDGLVERAVEADG